MPARRPMPDLSRRGLLGFLGAGIVAAPAIVRVSSLMPLRATKWPRYKSDFLWEMEVRGRIWNELNSSFITIDPSYDGRVWLMADYKDGLRIPVLLSGCIEGPNA
jgi:hypothetical protein